MKRVLALVTVCLLLTQFGMSSATDGSTEPEPNPDPAPVMIITHVSLPDESVVTLLEQGGDVHELSLPKAYCAWDDGSEWGKSDYLDMAWDLDAVDPMTPGWSYVEGQVILPEGLAFPGEAPTLRCQLLVYDPEEVGGATLLGASVAQNSNVVPCGTDEKAREAFRFEYGIDAVGTEALTVMLMERWTPHTGILYPGTFYLADDQGQSFRFEYPITCDFSMADMETPGSYPIFSAPPAYFQYSDAARQGMVLHVMEPDQVDLRAWNWDGFGVVTMEWFLHIESPELWVSVDEGEWHGADTLMEDGLAAEMGELTTPYFFYEHWKTGKIYRLQILESMLVTGHVYEFEVRYENEGHSVNSLLIDLRDGRPNRFSNGGGSRGGSDREETETPPVDSGGGSYHPGPVTPDKKPKPPVVAEMPPTPTPTPAPVEESPAPEATSAIPSAPPEDTPPVDIAQEDIPPHMSVDEAVTLPPPAEAPPSPTPKIRKSTATAQSPSTDVPAEARKEEAEPAATMPPPDASPPLPTEEGAPQEPPITLDLPPVPVVEEPESPAQAPISGPVAIIVVGGGAALGAAAIWKLLGKWLVKRR